MTTEIQVRIRHANVDDAPEILEIYNHEVLHETSTFDLVPRTLEAQRSWLEARSGALTALVAVDESGVVGFGALNEYRDRAAYSTTVEDSVYVRRDRARRGIGRALLEALIDQAADGGFHAIMARIEASGTASRSLHAACGFDLIGVERETGRKFGRWLDVAIMQRMLREPTTRA